MKILGGPLDGTELAFHLDDQFFYHKPDPQKNPENIVMHHYVLDDDGETYTYQGEK